MLQLLIPGTFFLILITLQLCANRLSKVQCGPGTEAKQSQWETAAWFAENNWGRTNASKLLP